MSGVLLRLKQSPTLRVDLRGIVPTALAGLSTDAIGRLEVVQGNQRLAVAELFDVAVMDASIDLLTLEGDLSRFDRIGWQMGGGTLVVDGPAGDHAGGGMTAGSLHVKGSVGVLAACEMAGGEMTIDGDAGDFAAGPLPGSMDGMRGGTLIVKGHVGDRFADRMRRGSALVFGNAGDFLASRLVAGTIAIGGTVGAHAGYGMRRGSLVFAGPAPAVGTGFVPALVDPKVFWQLLSRDLARHGGPFARLPGSRITRHLGDVTAGGKGEWILAG